MESSYRISPLTEYDPRIILPLYESVGWIAYTRRPQMLEAAFRQSLATYAAWQGEELAGLIRVVGDGASVLLVQDLLVHPAHQRRGIGTMLMEQVLQAYPQVYQRHLFTDGTEAARRFYASLGFRPGGELGCHAFCRVNRG